MQQPTNQDMPEDNIPGGSEASGPGNDNAVGYTPEELGIDMPDNRVLEAANGPGLTEADLGPGGLGEVNIGFTGAIEPVDIRAYATSGTEQPESGLEADLSAAGVESPTGGEQEESLVQPADQPAAARASNGQTVLITGASSGIGYELANVFAKNGYDLVLVARSESVLRQTARKFEEQYGILATVIREDLADPEAPGRIYTETQRQGLTVDVLVNNAGMGEYGLFATQSDLQKELAIVQINSVSLMHLTKLFLKDMVARNKGKILLLGSVASVVPHPLMAVYGATKAFNYSFGEALRNELKDTAITVTVLMPTATDTDFFRKAGAEHTVVRQQARAVSAAEVARAGYGALMAGKDKKIPGMMAKMQVASAFMLPDQVITQYMRSMLEDEQQMRQSVKRVATTALVAGVALLGGWWLLSSRQRSLS